MHPHLAITGIGLTTSLGRGVEANWRRLRAGESGMRPLRTIDVRGYPVKSGGEVEDPEPAAAHRDGHVAPPELVHLLEVCREALAGAGGLGVARAERFGCAIGSSLAASTSSQALFEDRRARGAAGADYGFLRGYFVDRSFQLLADELGLEGPFALVSNACAAGAGAIARAADWIRDGRCDAALAAGFDAFSIFTFAGFGSLFALARERSRPFQEGRDGMKIGGGWAALVLEPLARARQAGREPIARLRGYGESSDAHHLTHPHPQGLGAVLAMRRALAAAGLEPEAIDAVNCHATATPSNDAAELAALRAVFGERLRRIPLYAPKPAVGHTLGAAGAVEAVQSALFLREQFLAPTVDAGPVDPAFGLELDLLRQGRPARLRHVMSNSFGFGGSNASLIFSCAGKETEERDG